MQLLEITKIQILKVIHNVQQGLNPQNEVVGNHKDTNFESNSQLRDVAKDVTIGCWKSQRYKF